MLLDLTPDELLTTTRSVRRRLDFDRPVSRAVVEECIEIALQAPTGSNRQHWHFVCVDDPGVKAAIAELYARGFDAYINLPGPQYSPDDPRARRQAAIRESAVYLRDNLHRVPVMVIPCGWGRLPPGADVAVQAGYWGSILPAAWSFMLALRARGLGSAWTTLHLPYEREAAEVLGIPHERVTQAGLFPVAYTIGTEFRPASRIPVAEVVHWNVW
ncbi:MAG: nitroreductase [Acidimicrobiia bacterium]